MSTAVATLRTLHRIHRQLEDLRDRLERGPRQVRLREAQAARLEAEATEAKNALKAAKVAADQKQLLLRSGETKIKDLQAKLNAANNNREYQALKDQIATDEMTNSVLADEILEALEKIDQATARVKEADQALVKAREDAGRFAQTVRDQEGALQAELARVEAELQAAEAELPDDYREAYLRLARSRGADALSVVEGETCGGCNQHLTPNQMNSLSLAKVVPCQSCGRVLYLPEDRTPGRGA